MTRALDDKTSTCESCAYWGDPRDDGAPTLIGDCGWQSLPAWTRRYIPINVPTTMRADSGRDCWQHTKRESGNSQGNAR